MPAGGTLTLAVRHGLREGPPDLAAARWCVAEVRDTGAGMDAGTQRRIFDPFFTTKTDGTGLGLATSFASVQQMGGTITVTSEPGAGSTFRIWLPQADAATPEAAFPATPREAVPEVTRRHVLIVDDDDAVREVMRRELSASHDVHVARSGDEALRVADALGERLSVMVTDIMMPGMRGTDLAARLADRWPSVRVLFVTGFPGDRATAGVLEAPGTALLTKPFTGTQLRQAVADLLAPAATPEA
jgi:CheY-like chemotaxis protein